MTPHKVPVVFTCIICRHTSQVLVSVKDGKQPQPIEGACRECKDKAFGFDEPEKSPRHTEMKDRKGLPLGWVF